MKHLNLVFAAILALVCMVVVPNVVQSQTTNTQPTGITCTAGGTVGQNCTPSPAGTTCPSPAPTLGTSCGVGTLDLNNLFNISKQAAFTTAPVNAVSTTLPLLTGNATPGTNYYVWCVTIGGNSAAGASGQLKVGTTAGGATPVGGAQVFASTATNTAIFWPPGIGPGTSGTCLLSTLWISLQGAATTNNLYITTGSVTPSPSPSVSAYIYYITSNQ